MKKIWIIPFLLLVKVLSADEELDVFDFKVSKEHIIDKRENYFLTSTDYKIAPKVNPITGEYCEEEVDLVVAGSTPLSVRRFHNSSSPYDARYASWRYNPEAFFVANMEWKGQEIFAAIGDIDGSVCSLKPSKFSGTFDFQLPKGFAISGSDGTSHPLNIKIDYWKLGDPKDKNRFQYMGTITDGSGRKRTFASPMHRWTHRVRWREKKGNWMAGSETTWEIHPNTWTPFHIPILEERLPNGNILCYDYIQWGEEKLNYPLPKLLKSITAYNADKSQVLGYINFDYPRTKHGAVAAVQATGSDGRVAFMQHLVGNKCPIKLVSAKRAGAPLVSYTSEQIALNSITKPDGRVFTTEYYPDGKVSVQKASVGPNGEICPIGRYVYEDKLTIVYDAENNKTLYHYDENKKLTSMELYQGETLYRIDRFDWDPSTGNLKRKTIKDNAGNIVRIAEYEYDKNQNPFVERLGDGNEWRTIKRTYSDDGFNLKLTESDRPEKLVRYTYVPGTNLLASEFTCENDVIRKRIFHKYDDSAICVKTIIDDGDAEESENLHGVTYRKITYVTPKKSHPCFGLPEAVEEKTIDSSGKEILLHKTCYKYTAFGKTLQEDHYDAQNVYHHSLINTYDDNECLKSTTDPLGHQTFFTYDANHNLTSITGPKPNQCKEVTYDKANRPRFITDRQNDGTFVIIEKKYDKLGHVIEEIDACKNSTFFTYDSLGRVKLIQHPDGALEQKVYNVLGQVTQEIDPKGYVTTKKYNAFGQITYIYHPDGTEEYFTYYPTGTLQSHTDKNGCTIKYKYDIFDRPIEEVYLSNNQELKINKSSYTPFCKLSDTDGEGNTTYYTHDFSGRKTSETTGTKKTLFTYDSIGLLEKTDCQYFEQTEKYDKAGHLKCKILSSEKIQFQENYDYDEVSNCIHRITSHGAFETLFNTLGKPFKETNPTGYSTTHSYHFGDCYSKVSTDANHIQTKIIHDNRGREKICIKTNSQGKILAKSENGYDLNGNPTTETHYVYGPELIRTITHTWEYGPQNRLESFTAAGKRKTEYRYDEKGHLKTIIKPSDIQLHYEYDPLGRLKRYYSSDFDYYYTYDCNDQLRNVYDSISKTTTTRDYNALGDVTEETLATGLRFFNSYDGQGRRKKLTLPDNSEIGYVYEGAFLHQVIRNENTCTYKVRDLDGCILEMDLPIGTITITRDLLSRVATFTSPAYHAQFPKEAYDPVGNLKGYHYEDPLGKVKCTYAYDELNQLISEDEHTYCFDSLHNRLEKDHSLHIVNDLCQIEHDGSTSYKYDLDGNLIFDGKWRYTYDTQDRLIALESGNKRIQYAYDPFHRRLSKAVFVNGEQTHYERYLWDGDNEIGVVDERGMIAELRVLGEGLGAEIGSAVLYELNNKTYVTIHDHRGNLAVLIDVETQKPIETYRYTAFGEELTPATLSPWRFSSKRIEKEMGLIFFGRRYYLPTLGRWMTQDPQGFDDGPNLYAYLCNCPLISIDPYGLVGIDSWWALQDDYMGLTRTAVGNYYGFGGAKDYSSFENSYSNKSRTYNLNRDFDYKLPEPSIGGYSFGNGVGNTFSDLGGKARFISTYSGYNTKGVYNATHGLWIDAREACLNLNCRAMTPPVYLYHKEWDYYFDNDITGAPFWQGCHSQGSAQVRNALETYPKERRDRIVVAAFAPLAYIPKRLCMQVTHYVCPSDLIPYIDSEGKKACEDTIIYVPRMHNCKQSCHEFLNPIYAPYLKSDIEKYQALLQKYVR